jgi:putative spermidine/putrescine transport system permease protein
VGGLYRNISPNFEESAQILGCNRWQTFWHITFPMVRGAIFSGAIFALIISIDNVSLSLFFASPTTATLPVVMLSYLESAFDPSIAAASTVQLVIAVVLLLAIERIYGLKGITGA